MFSLQKPTAPQIHTYLANQSHAPFSYSFPGETRHAPKPRRGWNIDQARALLGHGQHNFDQARHAIDTWQMFPPSLTTVHFTTPQVQPPAEGQTVAILFRAALVRLWLLFPARVVYLLDETTHENGTTIHRHGFAYGTLPDHPERGEERFLVEWNETNNTVHYDLLAISQPAHYLARLAYPYTRQQQSRFRHLSCTNMQLPCQKS